MTRVFRFSYENRMKMPLFRGAREISMGLRHVSATAWTAPSKREPNQSLPLRGRCHEVTEGVCSCRCTVSAEDFISASAGVLKQVLTLSLDTTHPPPYRRSPFPHQGWFIPRGRLLLLVKGKNKRGCCKLQFATTPRKISMGLRHVSATAPNYI